MPYDPQPGDIITVEDFMDCLVYYLMPPVAEYQDKITVLFTDGLRLTIRRDQLMGLNEFVNGMNEVANFIDLTEFYEECTYRANSVISHLREIKYRPVEITGRDIVQSLWETYGEGIYNILSESAIRALNRVVV